MISKGKRMISKIIKYFSSWVRVFILKVRYGKRICFKINSLKSIYIR